ncbi:MAG: PAS domain-containing protein, partial [Hansschlegelia sp.]
MSLAPTGDVDDPDRLAVLRSYGILDTVPEEGFDDIVELACEICDAPVALVSFVEVDRQWFKARIGFGACETPIAQSVCAHALKEREMLVVPDLTLDPRTRDNTLVTQDPAVRFYAGVVLRSPEGQPLGTLCVLDTTPRPEGLTGSQASAMRALGRQVMAQLALRRAVSRSGDAIVEQARTQKSHAAAVAAAQARELKHRLAIEATKIGIFDYDLVTGELEWDARTRELFGVAAEDPVSYEGSFLKGLHPDDRKAVDDAMQASLDPHGSGLFESEYRIASPDGRTLRWIAALGQSIVAGGRATRLVGTVRDVTLRRLADEQIAATLERYALASRATNDAIWDWDLVTGHVLWNEALAAAYGYRLDKIDPTPGWRLDRIHPEDVERIHADIRRVIDGAEAEWRHEYRFRRADGRYADVFDRGYIIRDPRGAPLRMIGALLDLTERKAAEERQRLLNSELGHRMKNILSMVQAISAQTMRAAASMEEAQEVLSGRLVALGKAHDILLG